MSSTPSYVTLPQKAKGQYRFSAVRVMLISLMLFVLMAACLYLHHTAFRTLESDFSAAGKANSSWIVGELGYFLPVLTVCLFQLAVYARHDRQDGIAQKEMALEIIIATLLIYAVVLPVVMYISDYRLTLQLAAGAEVEKTPGDAYRTLLIDMAEWFVRLPVPMLFLYLFHRSKASHEPELSLDMPTEASEPSARTESDTAN